MRRRLILLLGVLLAGCATCTGPVAGSQTIQVGAAFYTMPWPTPRCE